MTLTEQWKKGELEEGCYYLKDDEYIFIDYFDGVIFKETYDFEIKEVLAPVPSYEEYLRLGKKIKKRCVQIQKVTDLAFKRKKEIKKLKELLHSLKCCLTSENIETQIRIDKSLGKINEVLK